MKFKLAVALVSALALAACNKKTTGNSPNISVSPGAIANDASLSPSQKAEKLAEAAEQLVTPASFMYADSVADMALTLDSGNGRAQLIKAVLKPAILTKGIAVRIRPLYETTTQGKTNYQNMIADIQKWPNDALKKFLLDGEPDIKTEADAQKYLDANAKAFDDMRLFFKNHKDLELTIHIPELWKQDRITQRSQDCVARADYTNDQNGVYTLNCDFTNVMELKVNRADNEIFQQIAAGMEIYELAYNAYRLDGVAAYAKSIDAQAPSSISNQQTFNALLKTKSFGTVRNSQGLKNVLAMGLDAVAGARWALGMQSSLCPNGANAKTDNRPGYVFNQGLCAPQDPVDQQGDSAASVLRTAEFALQGGVLTATVTNLDNGSKFDTSVNPSAALAKPVQDVRALGPFTWDPSKDQVTSIGDGTYGGLFPRGDGNKVTAVQNSEIYVHGAQ